jgi:hypothetical protein
MLALLILSVILGAVVAGLTGIGFLFWVAAIFVFICGLPVALVTGFIHSEVEYAQDRADFREEMKQLVEEERELDRQIAEDLRMERYLDKLDTGSITYVDKRQYHDNRQVHYHNSPSAGNKMVGRRKNS